jgi:hypothetical protein
MTTKQKKAQSKRPNRSASDDDEEILAMVAHIPDRDQEFHAKKIDGTGDRWVGGAGEDRMQGVQDIDEGDSGVVSDPAYEREGASRILRSANGDRSVEEHMTPAARSGAGGNDDPRGIEHLSRDELRKRAQALNIPGRSKMTKIQLSTAVHAAMQP